MVILLPGCDTAAVSLIVTFVVELFAEIGAGLFLRSFPEKGKSSNLVFRKSREKNFDCKQCSITSFSKS